MSQAALDPGHIMQVGMGFWPSKVVLSAVELGLFTELGDEALTGEELGARLGLHPRAIADFLDALVALRLLDREGDGSDGRYRNTPETAAFLDRKSPAYVGGILEMANARLYRFWGDLTEALRTGKPQNEIKHTGKPMFDELYARPGAARAVHGRDDRASRPATSRRSPRSSTSRATRRSATSAARPASSARSGGRAPSAPALHELRPAGGDADRRARDRRRRASRPRDDARRATSSPIRCRSADVITMGMILHDWNLERKRHADPRRLRRAAARAARSS